MAIFTQLYPPLQNRPINDNNNNNAGSEITYFFYIKIRDNNVAVLYYEGHVSGCRTDFTDAGHED